MMQELDSNDIQVLNTLDEKDARVGGGLGAAFDPKWTPQLEKLSDLDLIRPAGSFLKGKTYWQLTALGEQVLEVQQQVLQSLKDEFGDILG
jgi:hypothetical protein